MIMERRKGTELHDPTINQFADQFRKRFSRFQSIAAIMDLVKRPPTVDRQEAWTQRVSKVEDVSDISSCSCAIYLRRSKRQDLSTSG